MSNTVVFLGAGASKALGLPITKVIFPKLLELHWCKRGYRRAIQRQQWRRPKIQFHHRAQPTLRNRNLWKHCFCRNTSFGTRHSGVLRRQ